LEFRPNLDEHCCSANKFTFGELKDIVEEVRAIAPSRPTLVDASPFGDPSIAYFATFDRYNTRSVHGVDIICKD
jgi:hypothetical protein